MTPARPELLERVQQAYFAVMQTPVARLLHAVMDQRWADVVNYSPVEDWAQALAAVITYASSEVLGDMCATLADRLEKASFAGHRAAAGICYVCAGRVSEALACWERITAEQQQPQEGEALLRVVEQASILRLALASKRQDMPAVNEVYVDRILQLCTILAEQGALNVAQDIARAALHTTDPSPGGAERKANFEARLAIATGRQAAPVNYGGPVPQPSQSSAQRQNGYSVAGGARHVAPTVTSPLSQANPYGAAYNAGLGAPAPPPPPQSQPQPPQAATHSGYAASNNAGAGPMNGYMQQTRGPPSPNMIPGATVATTYMAPPPIAPTPAAATGYAPAPASSAYSGSVYSASASVTGAMPTASYTPASVAPPSTAPAATSYVAPSYNPPPAQPPTPPAPQPGPPAFFSAAQGYGASAAPAPAPSTGMNGGAK
jgi:hypothetical protein